jgi:hypothetical protein
MDIQALPNVLVVVLGASLTLDAILIGAVVGGVYAFMKKRG